MREEINIDIQAYWKINKPKPRLSVSLNRSVLAQAKRTKKFVTENKHKALTDEQSIKLFGGEYIEGHFGNTRYHRGEYIYVDD